MAEIVNAKLSKCCSHSVSSNNGSKEIPKHYYTCNKCNKVTEMLEIPYWEITDKGKYKKLQ